MLQLCLVVKLLNPCVRSRGQTNGDSGEWNILIIIERIPNILYRKGNTVSNHTELPDVMHVHFACKLSNTHAQLATMLFNCRHHTEPQVHQWKADSKATEKASTSS